MRETATRADLHRLLDAIPDGQLAAAAAALEPLVDPLTRALLRAPEDDEPLTDEERALIEKARAEAEVTGYIPHAEVKRRHGLP
jgi:hypothetical protein